jgi:opacity protein-like surface antigen
MDMTRIALLALGLVVVSATSAAADAPTGAEESPVPVAGSDAGSGSGSAAPAVTKNGYDSFNLPKGQLFIDAFFTMDLSINVAGQGISLSPDIWYGITDDITVGLVHSTVGETGFLGGIGDSLCFSGKTGECASFYNNVGADLRYRLKAPWSVDAGLFIDSFSPDFDLGVKLGIDGRWRFGKIGLEIQPNLFIELTNRESGADKSATSPEEPGNEEALRIPVTGSFTVIPKLDVYLQTGLDLPFDRAGDFFAIPLSIGARYAVTPKLSLGLAFTLTQLVGGSALDTGADFRVIQLGGSYAL